MKWIKIIECEYLRMSSREGTPLKPRTEVLGG
jgi:hypothetical protein